MEMKAKGKNFCCLDCGYFCSRNTHLLKHFTSNKHLTRNHKEEIDLACKYQCKQCNKKYKGQSGLWQHSKKCLKVSQPNVVDGIDLLQKIDNLEKVIENLTELVKNQQPSTVINNNNNNINIFLNEKCKNAYDITKFIESIDFTKEDFEKLIMNYVEGNAEIIEKNYKSLSEFERPIYCFEGEDKNQKIAHIQHENQWKKELELDWERQVQREQNDIDDEPVPNSLYSLVRLFDKKKLKYYDDKYKNSHLYLKQRKFNKDCLDGDNQIKLIKKIIDMVTIATNHKTPVKFDI